jgi:hypothetical protein
MSWDAPLDGWLVRLRVKTPFAELANAGATGRSPQARTFAHNGSAEYCHRYRYAGDNLSCAPLLALLHITHPEPNGTAVMCLTWIREMFGSNPFTKQANMSEIFLSPINDDSCPKTRHHDLSSGADFVSTSMSNIHGHIAVLPNHLIS